VHRQRVSADDQEFGVFVEQRGEDVEEIGVQLSPSRFTSR
jgi:hypothetical protein